MDVARGRVFGFGCVLGAVSAAGVVCGEPATVASLEATSRVTISASGGGQTPSDEYNAASTALPYIQAPLLYGEVLSSDGGVAASAFGIGFNSGRGLPAAEGSVSWLFTLNSLNRVISSPVQLAGGGTGSTQGDSQGERHLEASFEVPARARMVLSTWAAYSRVNNSSGSASGSAFATVEFKSAGGGVIFQDTTTALVGGELNSTRTRTGSSVVLDAGVYRLTAATLAGASAASGEGGARSAEMESQVFVVLTFTPEPCAADFNGDGFVDFFDFQDFVDCFEDVFCADGTTADFNGDGFVDFFDFQDYVDAFEAGC